MSHDDILKYEDNMIKLTELYKTIFEDVLNNNKGYSGDDPIVVLWNNKLFITDRNKCCWTNVGGAKAAVTRNIKREMEHRATGESTWLFRQYHIDKKIEKILDNSSELKEYYRKITNSLINEGILQFKKLNDLIITEKEDECLDESNHQNHLDQ